MFPTNKKHLAEISLICKVFCVFIMLFSVHDKVFTGFLDFIWLIFKNIGDITFKNFTNSIKVF